MIHQFNYDSSFVLFFCLLVVLIIEAVTRYNISSLHTDAELIDKSIRQHWTIENKLHWMLDLSFKEDASGKRKGHSTQSYSMISKVALNLTKQIN
jgi:predicted transposase YbfD/YdcC